VKTLIILILTSTGANVERIYIDECPPDTAIREFEQYYSTNTHKLYVTCGDLLDRPIRGTTI